MTKRTTTPWHVALPDETIVTSPEGDVAQVLGDYDVEFERMAAQARLIAAAPDLLDALRDLLDAYSKPDERLCCTGQECGCQGATVREMAEHYAREAIAKAKGRA